MIPRDISEQAIALAERLLISSLEQQTRAERAASEKLGRMLNDPQGKAFTFAVVDKVFRSHLPATSARRWREMLRDYGIPRYAPLIDRWMMRASALGSRLLPAWVMRAVEARMRADSKRVILPGEKVPLNRYLDSRAADGFQINLNQLGEAIVGEEEAARRLAAVITHLGEPRINYISIKISAIFSQINLVAWDETLVEIKNRLRTLYRVAASSGKFINLDMEEYRDLNLTMQAFQSVLDEPEFHALSAGMVLQAYLPDSFAAQQKLTDWACRRVARRGAPIKIRLVKGANLAMENVEAELHGWQPAPYSSKAETDANFRRMLEFGCQPAHALSVRLGVASHNLFDVALALTLRETNGVEKFVEIEMLEGMANHQARAVRDVAGGLLLYSPVVQREDFLSAMAYLVRRLDENTSPENFLRDMFSIRADSDEWKRQRSRFLQGWNDRLMVSAESRRAKPAVEPRHATEFMNEPDSDWTQSATRIALTTAIEKYESLQSHDQLGGVPPNREIEDVSAIPSFEAMPELPDLEAMLTNVSNAQSAWERLGAEHRAMILNRAADIMSDERFESLAMMRIDAKKAISEADGEVSEAIDFARYYARTYRVPSNVEAHALGVVAVISPWNFPYAIPAGGIFAALMAGNSVVFKPARATMAIAWHLARQLWRAGVPRDVLQFFPCDNDVGKKLIVDSRIQSVVLTGSYETARKFQQWRPSLSLMAETSGKNAIIVTAQADRELAIKDLVRSAFGHSGQKCSAASLAILEAEVYDDPIFRRQLLDAAASLPTGPATDPRSVVTPLVILPGLNLRRALTQLDSGESWLLEPRRTSNDPCSWTAGIKLGVQPGSWLHRTECFGPVLGLMRADSLAQATQWQNATDYGLTAGLHSLDPVEIAWWRDQVQAGNLYINRPITGAIVQRQPFGGWKRSCIGPGAKAGGPNYAMSFCHLKDTGMFEPDYDLIWSTHFAIEHDPSNLRAESNIFRYRACRGVILRLESANQTTIHRAQFASKVSGSPLIISIRKEESDAQFLSRLPVFAKQAEFFRTIVPPSDEVLQAVQEVGLNWINAPLLDNGRIELTRWLREQSVTETLHRYGQVSERDVTKSSSRVP